jgi:uncharacterized protein YuzE
MTDKSEQYDCGHCGDPILPGQGRRPYTHPSGETTTIHDTCYIPHSPVPHIDQARLDDWIEIEIDDGTVAGKIVGTGQTTTPAKGWFLRIEAREWDPLPTDQVIVIHEYKNGSWVDVHLYVNDIWVDNENNPRNGWRDAGKVVDLELEREVQE